jgi:cytochrome c peroxidase
MSWSRRRLRRLPQTAARLGTVGAVTLIGLVIVAPTALYGGGDSLDLQLRAELRREGFTGRIEQTLDERIGRTLDPKLADLGRLLWFDTVTGLQGDNTCGGCHSPTNGFGDSQPIAIGIDNNGVVGPDRSGPRNMRRSPSVINTAFFPNLMWNSRFSALSRDPFDNRAGFEFPLPEGLTLSDKPHLLVAQAFIPPTERTEVAGFEFPGTNDDIRAEVLRRLNAVAAYRKLFAITFPEVRRGDPITFDMFGSAIAEFEFSLTFANAPIDRYARGQENALSRQQKEGALLFFRDAGCVSCHAVSGASNEMFSDFENHVLAVPQLVPANTNNTFDGAELDQDFGREQVTGRATDRYAFRTSPLRNVAVQAAFMHDGAFLTLSGAIRHHLDVVGSLRSYDPAAQGLPADLAATIGPIEPMLNRLDPLVTTPRRLSADQLEALTAFVSIGLLDEQALPARLRSLVPKTVPSGRRPLTFQFDERGSG